MEYPQVVMIIDPVKYGSEHTRPVKATVDRMCDKGLIHSLAGDGPSGICCCSGPDSASIIGLVTRK